MKARRSPPATASAAAPVSTRLAVRVIPGAPRDEVCGWLGDALKVKLHAPPLDGRANEALIELLAAHLGLPRRAVTLEQGAKSRQKVLRLDGLDDATLRARLL